MFILSPVKPLSVQPVNYLACGVSTTIKIIFKVSQFTEKKKMSESQSEDLDLLRT